jgi:hypothetical protein
MQVVGVFVTAMSDSEIDVARFLSGPLSETTPNTISGMPDMGSMDGALPAEDPASGPTIEETAYNNSMYQVRISFQSTTVECSSQRKIYTKPLYQKCRI